MGETKRMIGRFVGVVVVILPLLFGVIIGLITETYTHWLGSWYEAKEVRCCIEGVTEHVNPEILGDAKLAFNGIDIRRLCSYRITVLNSGKKGIDNITVYVEFIPESNPFQILADHHKTDPPEILVK